MKEILFPIIIGVCAAIWLLICLALGLSNGRVGFVGGIIIGIAFFILVIRIGKNNNKDAKI